jgi:hypothetical protein
MDCPLEKMATGIGPLYNRRFFAESRLRAFDR